MLRSTALAGLLAGLSSAAAGQTILGSEGMAGVGVQGCETIAGAENAPVLAAAVDWGLGYLAGRRDGGHRPVTGEPLSTTDPADLATGLVLYCREHPHGLVLDALRTYGLRVFAEGPDADPPRGPRLPRVRPRPRPADAAVLVAADSSARAERPDAAGAPRAATARPEAATGAATAAAALARRAASEALLIAAIGARPGGADGAPPGVLTLVEGSPPAAGALDLRAGDGSAPAASPRPPARPQGAGAE